MEERAPSLREVLHQALLRFDNADLILDALRDFARTHPLEAAQALGWEQVGWGMVRGPLRARENEYAFRMDLSPARVPGSPRSFKHPLFAAPQEKTE